MVIVVRYEHYDSFSDSIATLLTNLEIIKPFKTEIVITHQFLHPRTNSVWRRFKYTLDFPLSFFRRYNTSVVEVNRTYSGIHSTVIGNSSHKGNKEVANSGRRSADTQWYAERNTLGNYASAFLTQARNEGLCIVLWGDPKWTSSNRSAVTTWGPPPLKRLKTDRHDWKLYLPANSLASVNNQRCVYHLVIRLPSVHLSWCQIWRGRRW